MSLISAKNLKKTFYKGNSAVEVVRGVDIEIKEGEFVALVGESGSGKSTLLYLLSGFEKPTEGEVVLLGRNLGAVTDEELAKMRRRDYSFVNQSDNLISNLTALENIELPLILDKKDLKKEKDKINGILEYLNIKDCVKRYPSELSGGEQQRVALARALVTEPKLIFLDEPTGSLDAQMGKQVMELLREINLNKKVALLLVTHSASHASYASRIIKIADGKIVND
ncbi:MAG: ABC transporter ATP-binding protein [Clostridiales bacterium]|nr:ABC transporter ATP-binding protein [Clostridiales bacterium]